MNRTLSAMLGSLVALLVALLLLARVNSPRAGQADPLLLFCAASNRAVVNVILEDYKQEFGRTVQVQYGPSQTLLATIEVIHTGDLFLPADESFLKMAKAKGLVDDILPLAEMQAVVVVRRGNPKGIKVFADLLKEEVQFVQASFDSAAIGKLTRDILRASQQWAVLENATDAFRSSVTDVANDVLVGAADAGIVYDAVLHTYPGLEFVRLPELAAAKSKVAVGILTQSQHSAAAMHLACYLAAADRGAKRYREFGFKLDSVDDVDAKYEVRQ